MCVGCSPDDYKYDHNNHDVDDHHFYNSNCNHNHYDYYNFYNNDCNNTIV